MDHKVTETEQIIMKNPGNDNCKDMHAVTEEPTIPQKSEQSSTMGENPFIFSTPLVSNPDQKEFQNGQWTGLSTDSGFSDKTVDTTWTPSIREAPFSAQSLTSLSSIQSISDSSPACGRRLTLTDNTFSPINRKNSKILQGRKLEFKAFDERPPPLQFSSCDKTDTEDHESLMLAQGSVQSVSDDTDMEIIGFEISKYTVSVKDGSKNRSPSLSGSSISPRSRMADDLEISLQEMSLEETSSSGSGQSPRHLKSFSPSPTSFTKNFQTIQRYEAEKEQMDSEVWEYDKKVCAQGEKISAMSLDDCECTENISMASSIDLRASPESQLNSPVISKQIPHTCSSNQDNKLDFSEKVDFLSSLALAAVNSKHSDSGLFSTPISRWQSGKTHSGPGSCSMTNESLLSEHSAHNSHSYPHQSSTNSTIYHLNHISHFTDEPPIAPEANLPWGLGSKAWSDDSECYSTDTLPKNVAQNNISSFTSTQSNIPCELKSPSKRCRDSHADSESGSLLLFSPTKAARRQLSPSNNNYKQNHKSNPSPRKASIRKIQRDDKDSKSSSAIRKILTNDSDGDGKSQKVCCKDIQIGTEVSNQIQLERTPQFLNLSSLPVLPEKTEVASLENSDKSRSPIHRYHRPSNICCEKWHGQRDSKCSCNNKSLKHNTHDFLLKASSTSKHSPHELLQAVLEKFSPAKPASLIGRNVGVRKFDVIQQLSCKQFTLCLDKIFQHLSAEDLVRVSKVSRDWKFALHQVRQASDRYRNHLRLQSRIEIFFGDGKENCGEKVLDHHSHRLTASRGHLTSMQSQAEKSELIDVPSVIEPKDHLLSEDRLKMCPHCQGSALVKPQQDRAVCLNTKCGFDFCTKCFTTFHHPKPCKPLFRAPSKAGVAGTKKSRNNLRRL